MGSTSSSSRWRPASTTSFRDPHCIGRRPRRRPVVGYPAYRSRLDIVADRRRQLSGELFHRRFLARLRQHRRRRSDPPGHPFSPAKKGHQTGRLSSSRLGWAGGEAGGEDGGSLAQRRSTLMTWLTSGCPGSTPTSCNRGISLCAKASAFPWLSHTSSTRKESPSPNAT